MALQYMKRTGRGRKSVSGERYDPTADFGDEEPIKVVPKSDEQRKRLQTVAAKIMLLNRLDEVFDILAHEGFLIFYLGPRGFF